MRKYIKILSFAVMMGILSGCFEDPGTAKLLEDLFVSLSVSSQQTGEGDGDGEILVEISKAQSSDITVNFDLTATNAVNGVDFDLGATSATIPAGQFSAVIPYTVTDDDVFQGVPRTFTLTITDVSAPGIEVNGNSAVTVTIVDDDCLYDADSWEGTFDAIEDYGTSVYGPYDLELVQDGTDPNRFNMSNFYDSGLDAYIVFDGATATVRFPDQSPATGFPITDSSGTFEQCNNEAVITLTFNGDTFLYRLTKQ